MNIDTFKSTLSLGGAEDAELVIPYSTRFVRPSLCQIIQTRDLKLEVGSWFYATFNFGPTQECRIVGWFTADNRILGILIDSYDAGVATWLPFQPDCAPFVDATNARQAA